ncbi:MAG: nucleoside phosphorylase [Bacteroidetes bacterium]|nr:nucleoside phosphorylase [Bacteroidota bacterium]
MKYIPESELILNADKSVYHLNLKPEDISNTIILVGDKDRVPLISSLFDTIELKKNKREFYSHTGYYKNKRISVVSSGIGPDNIDIVINELDALVNINLEKRVIKDQLSSLNFIRIGTCGTLHHEIPLNSFIVSDYGLGFDNLLKFYKGNYTADEMELYDRLKQHLLKNDSRISFYLYSCSNQLKQFFQGDFYHGITVTAPGFFGPQGREVRAALAYPDLNDHLANFEYKNQKVLNFEMETSAIYGLSKLMGHHAITVDLVLANRATGEAASNYTEQMKMLAQKVLDIVADSKEL